jgi:hypothetical protein
MHTSSFKTSWISCFPPGARVLAVVGGLLRDRRLKPTRLSGARLMAAASRHPTGHAMGRTARGCARTSNLHRLRGRAGHVARRIICLTAAAPRRDVKVDSSRRVHHEILLEPTNVWSTHVVLVARIACCMRAQPSAKDAAAVGYSNGKSKTKNKMQIQWFFKLEVVTRSVPPYSPVSDGGRGPFAARRVAKALCKRDTRAIHIGFKDARAPQVVPR